MSKWAYIYKWKKKNRTRSNIHMYRYMNTKALNKRIERENEVLSRIPMSNIVDNTKEVDNRYIANELLKELTYTEKVVMESLYFYKHTLVKTGNIIGISHEMVRLTKNKVLDKLRQGGQNESIGYCRCTK